MILGSLKPSTQKPSHYRSLKGEYWRKDIFSQENIFDMIALSQEGFCPQTEAAHNLWDWINIFVVSEGMGYLFYRSSPSTFFYFLFSFLLLSFLIFFHRSNANNILSPYWNVCVMFNANLKVKWSLMKWSLFSSLEVPGKMKGFSKSCINIFFWGVRDQFKVF